MLEKRWFNVLLLGCGLLPWTAAAASLQFANNLTAVTVDGSTAAGGGSVSVIQDGGTYHMWYRTSQGTIGGLSHATSSDGVHFTTEGSMSFSADPFPTGTPPYLYYENAAQIGGDYTLLHWTYNGGAGTYPGYDYNISASNIGSDPNNLAATHQGAVTGGTLGQTAGPFGVVNDYLYMQGGIGQSLMRASYTSGASPSVGALTDVLNLQAFFNLLGISGGYINNHSDVIAGKDGSLDFFFTVRGDSGGTRYNQQVYHSQSTDGGSSWGAPEALFSSVSLDGLAPGANFAHAEAVFNGSNYRLYLSTQDASGNYVVATATDAVPEPGTLALLGLGIVALAGARARKSFVERRG
jgi:hypothetical protein